MQGPEAKVGVEDGRHREQSTGQDLRPFFYDVAELPGYTIEEIAGDGDGAQEMYDLFGRDLVTKTILMSPKLSVFHESAKPGERVKPHRHGTHQLTYVLRGELHLRQPADGRGHGLLQPRRVVLVARRRRGRGVDRDPRR